MVTISTYYNSCLDWYSMYAIRYKELVKEDEGINNNMEKKRDKRWIAGYIRIYKVFFNVKILKIFPKKKIKFIDIIRKNEYSLF